jgi:hypothetical protein
VSTITVAPLPLAPCTRSVARSSSPGTAAGVDTSVFVLGLLFFSSRVVRSLGMLSVRGVRVRVGARRLGLGLGLGVKQEMIVSVRG